MVKIIIISLMAMSLMVSCFSFHKENLSANPEPYKAAIRSTYDIVWERAISFFADKGIEIQRANKSVGLISSYEAELRAWSSPYGRSLKRHSSPDDIQYWRWCSGRPYKMDFYVHIKPRADTDSIDISISAVFYLYDGGKCISTGECEKRFLEYVCEGE